MRTMTRTTASRRCRFCKGTPHRARSLPACSMSIRNRKTCIPISTLWIRRSTSSTRKHCVRAPPRWTRSTPACAEAHTHKSRSEIYPCVHVVLPSSVGRAMIVFSDWSMQPGGPMALSGENKVARDVGGEPIDVISTGAALGAEVRGVDLKDLDVLQFAALKRAWHHHQVILTRGQTLSDRDLIAFSRRFGDLDWAPVQETGRRFVEGLPEIYIVSNVTVNGQPIGSLGAGEAVWHADMSYLNVPPLASMLYAPRVTPAGVHTSLCSMYAVYEALPDELKHRIADP